nr:loricrin-like [Arachis hypogaea]
MNALTIKNKKTICSTKANSDKIPANLDNTQQYQETSVVQKQTMKYNNSINNNSAQGRALAQTDELTIPRKTWVEGCSNRIGKGSGKGVVMAGDGGGTVASVAVYSEGRCGGGRQNKGKNRRREGGRVSSGERRSGVADGDCGGRLVVGSGGNGGLEGRGGGGGTER